MWYEVWILHNYNDDIEDYEDYVGDFDNLENAKTYCENVKERLNLNEKFQIREIKVIKTY